MVDDALDEGIVRHADAFVVFVVRSQTEFVFVFRHIYSVQKSIETASFALAKPTKKCVLFTYIAKNFNRYLAKSQGYRI